MKSEILPKGWEIVPIEQIAQIISGGTPSSKDESNFTEKGKGIAWLTPADLSKYNQIYIKNGARDLTEKGYKSCSARLMPKGSVLLSSRAPIGYLAIAQNEISTNQGFKSFVFDDSINPEYAYFYLKSIKSHIESLGRGTTFKEVSATSVKTIPFVKAPLPEQQRLAQKFTILLDEVEQIKNRLVTIPALLKTFRQSVLARAVSGDLSAKWREENGVALESWENSKISNEITLISGQDLKPEQYSDEKIGIPYITGASNFNNGVLNINRYTKEPNKIAKKDDLLITCKGTIGEMLFFTESEAHIARQIMAIRAGEHLKQEFIKIYFLSNVDKLKAKAKGLIPGIARADILALDISIPSLEEQNYITQTVKTYLDFADQIETQVQQALERVNLMTQAILAKGFRGAL